MRIRCERQTEVMVEALLIQSGAVNDIPLKQAIHRGNLARKATSAE